MDRVQTSIGIDLGNTNSRVGAWQTSSSGENLISVISDEEGQLATPSFVSFAGEVVLIGHEARRQRVHPHSETTDTVFDIQRLIGWGLGEVENWKRSPPPFKIVQKPEGNHPMVQVELNGKPKYYYNAEELSGMILSKLKVSAEQQTGKSLQHAVFTVPYHFDEPQRQVIRDAAAIAGIQVQRLLSKPTAVAIGSGWLDYRGPEKNLLVVMIGGTAMNTALVTVEDGLFEIKGAARNTNVSGEGLDNLIAEHCLAAFQQQQHLPESKEWVELVDDLSRQRLLAACERAKCALSSSYSAKVQVARVFGGRDLNVQVTRRQLEALLTRESLLGPVNRALRAARVSKSGIDQVILAGGSVKVPIVEELLRDFFEGQEGLDWHVERPEQAAVEGATIYAAFLEGRKRRQEEAGQFLAKYSYQKPACKKAARFEPAILIGNTANRLATQSALKRVDLDGAKRRSLETIFHIASNATPDTTGLVCNDDNNQYYALTPGIPALTGTLHSCVRAVAASHPAAKICKENNTFECIRRSTPASDPISVRKMMVATEQSPTEKKQEEDEGASAHELVIGKRKPQEHCLKKKKEKVKDVGTNVLEALENAEEKDEDNDAREALLVLAVQVLCALEEEEALAPSLTPAATAAAATRLHPELRRELGARARAALAGLALLRRPRTGAAEVWAQAEALEAAAGPALAKLPPVGAARVAAERRARAVEARAALRRRSAQGGPRWGGDHWVWGHRRSWDGLYRAFYAAQEEG
uniref:Uncharacterized protein n=1 Tax=Heterosigma akashiwo TaxID=2829 RepID=A0A7S4DC27_HETAK